MKIQAVCEETGLTDKAVRYYINEGLVTPKYTQNYLGRRSYNFSLEDISLLSDISILRKFGFTVPEIRAVIFDPAKSISIISQVKERKAADITNNEKSLNAMSHFDFENEYTVSQIAQILSEATETMMLPRSDNRINFGVLVRNVIYIITLILGAAMLMPALLFAYTGLSLIFEHRYPHCNIPLLTVSLLLIISPFIIIVVLSLLKVKKHSKPPIYAEAAYLLSYFCVLIGIVLFVIMSYSSISMTTNIDNYLDFGSGDHMELYEVPSFFPKEVFTKQESSKPKYMYRARREYMGYSAEVFAQWTLTESAFNTELARIDAYFKDNEEYEIINKGEYVCYTYTPENRYLSAGFAYNTETHTVRYYYSNFYYDPIGGELYWDSVKW